MGRMYWFKHGVESVNLRIGSATLEPVNARMLASWLSYPDFGRLVERCVLTPNVGHAVIWGASDNARMTWWRDDDLAALGWTQHDCTGTVAKEHAGSSVFPIDDFRHHVGSHHQNVTSRSAGHELRPHREGVGKAGARHVDVESPGLLTA